MTTRERDFILECARIRGEEPDPSDPLTNYATDGAGGAFLDTERALQGYDAGEYCCDPTGAGETFPQTPMARRASHSPTRSVSGSHSFRYPSSGTTD